MSLPWSSSAEWKTDKEAFLFSLTDVFKKYVPECKSAAIYQFPQQGPCFSSALYIGDGKSLKSGRCLAENGDAAQYNIDIKSDGRNALTGVQGKEFKLA